LFFWRFVTEDRGDGTGNSHYNDDRFFHKQCRNLTQIVCYLMGFWVQI
jgi:hypothetical protein